MKRFIKALVGITITVVLSGIVFLYNIQLRSPFTTEEFIRLLDEPDTRKHPEKYIQTIREAMLAGEKSVTVSYVGSASELTVFAEDVIQEVFAVDDVSTDSDFDYMKCKYAGMQVRMEGMYRFYKVHYEFIYLETKEQTDEVDAKIDALFDKWEIDTMQEYQKVRKIHDYVVKNAKYDMSVKGNSAYYNLLEHKSACQGYAALLYKMLTRAGIPCRVITGMADGQKHAWNIVKLGSFWYNLDATWDDPIGVNEEKYVSYDYFLRGSDHFENHTSDGEFLTPEFMKKYDISIADYRP